MNGDVLAACWLVGEVLAVGSGWAARRSDGSRYQGLFQRLFFASLLVVSAATVVSLGLSPGFWLSSSVTLSLMVLTAICDFRPARRAGSW